jgi:hypothetical protein
MGHYTLSEQIKTHLYTVIYFNCDIPFFYFFYSLSGGWSPNWVHSARRLLNGLLYLPGWLWWWRIWWNKDWQGKPKYSEKTYPSATLSTTNPTWPGPGLNPGRRGGKPATNRLSYGAAMIYLVISLMMSRLNYIDSTSFCTQWKKNTKKRRVIHDSHILYKKILPVIVRQVRSWVTAKQISE